MIRTFVSLRIPDAVLDDIYGFIKKEAGNSFYSYRWTPKENLHITIKFIGEIEEAKVEEICEKLFYNKAEFDKLEMNFSEFGFFERNNVPSVFWISGTLNNIITGFAKHTEDILSEIGIPKEKRLFKPHLTLLRLKGSEDLRVLRQLKEHGIDKITYKPESIELIRSELSPGGSKYYVIKNLIK